MYNGITLLYTSNQHHSVNQLYSNIKQNLNKKNREVFPSCNYLKVSDFNVSSQILTTEPDLTLECLGDFTERTYSLHTLLFSC